MHDKDDNHLSGMSMTQLKRPGAGVFTRAQAVKAKETKRRLRTKEPSTLSPGARRILARTAAARLELDARCEGAEE